MRIQISSFRDNFGIKKRAPGSKCRIGGSMCRPVLQCVHEVPAGTSSPNQSAKYELEVPAGTSKLIKVPAGTSSFKQNRFQLLFWYLSIC